MTDTEIRDAEIQRAVSAILIRDEVNTRSIRSTLDDYMIYQHKNNAWINGHLARTTNALIHLERILDMDVDNGFSTITKVDLVRLAELLRSDGKSPHAVWNIFDRVTDFLEWAYANEAELIQFRYPEVVDYYRVADYEGWIVPNEALNEENWDELWHTVTPVELR